MNPNTLYRLKRRFRISFIFGFLAIIATCQPTLGANPRPQEENEGWLRLFDGESLFGWKAECQADWSAKNGSIHVTDGEQGLLRTTSQFDEFELIVEFRCPPETNSGIFLHTSPTPKDPTRDCLEFNIAPADNPFPTGSLVAREKTTQPFNPIEDQWNKIHLVLTKESFSATINDQEVINHKLDSSLGRGYIGLQHNSGPIEFRNIRLKPLNLTPLLNQQLNQWNQDLKTESTFAIDENNVLNVKGGRGQLETNESYGDFVFSMKCRTNAIGLNSGIFYRCIPNELMNGYESQIQNEIKENDPTQPKDCGTGGIFRRVDARRVVAKDQEWFTKTIVATGPHVSVWVNGFQVTDWSDTRKPDRNPRRGKRLDPGTIIIQGHDPTTDIDFKDILVREISTRNRR